jgi:hypothetical protein
MPSLRRCVDDQLPIRDVRERSSPTPVASDPYLDDLPINCFRCQTEMPESQYDLHLTVCGAARACTCICCDH